ncbi:hypothetical protein [Spirosoma pollinicola]|uniref:Lipocalin-like domain-containing protein n=1 Tax=Spirosoma pollinicola TaxID=2057025 RepID=A0A2K8Z205_9BACT|nr:hypothetical protein [Spirosoma pollinicola]AUD03922.1 hypothetical protein CWM47_20100 [Spirosoma pollinicola]
MIKSNWLTGLSLLMIGSFLACTRNTLSLPEPALSLAGTYQGKPNNTPFLINGETVDIQILPVAIDSVEVVMRGYVNGQQTDSLVYARDLVKQEFQTTALSKGCISYRIDLNTGKETNQLTMTCSEVNTLIYTFVPAGQTVGTRIRFKKS